MIAVAPPFAAGDEFDVGGAEEEEDSGGFGSLGEEMVKDAVTPDTGGLRGCGMGGAWLGLIREDIGKDRDKDGTTVQPAFVMKFVNVGLRLVLPTGDGR